MTSPDPDEIGLIPPQVVADNAAKGLAFREKFGRAAAAIVFLLLSSSPVIVLVLAHAVGGDSTARRIQGLKTFMLRNNNLIMMVVFAVLGVSVLGKGISGLGQ
jgi:hypothetical protein